MTFFLLSVLSEHVVDEVSWETEKVEPSEADALVFE